MSAPSKKAATKCTSKDHDLWVMDSACPQCGEKGERARAFEREQEFIERCQLAGHTGAEKFLDMMALYKELYQ